MTAKKAFLFDIGNVLLPFDFSRAVRRMLEKSPVSESLPEKIVTEIKDQYETGAISDEAFVSKSMALLSYSGTTEEFATAWVEIFTENAAMTVFINKAKAAGHPLLLLSNTNGLHKKYFTKTYSVFNQFDGGVYSHEAGSMKPDNEIYEQAIAQLKLVPNETIYIDDLPANIEAGRRFGFLSHQYDFNNHGAFLADVKKWGVDLD